MANFLANPSDSNNLISTMGEAAGKAEIKEQNSEINKANRRHEAQQTIRQGTQASLTDVASARKTERRTLEAEDSSWMAKNIHHLLAIGIMGLTFSLYTVVILGGSKDGFLKPETKDIVIYILGALTTVATQVVSYYFGSSSGSADKSKALSSIAKRG